MAGHITFSISLPVELNNRMRSFAEKSKRTNSGVIQNALRRYLHSEEIYEINSFLDSLDYDRIETLKDEIKKRERN